VRGGWGDAEGLWRREGRVRGLVLRGGREGEAGLTILMRVDGEGEMEG
jgi:hypothetical protein